MTPRMVQASFVTAFVLLLNSLAGPAWCQGESSGDAQAAKIQELEKRVRDLEDLVRRVEAKGVSQQVPANAHVNPSLATDQTLSNAGSPVVSPVPAQPVSFQEGTNPVPQDMQRIASAGIESGNSGTSGWDKGFFIESADKQHTLRITGQIQTDYRSFQNKNDTTDIDTFLLRRARFGIEATVYKFYEFRFLPDFGQGKSVIQDSYLNIHYVDEIQLQFGKFKEPVSYEQLVQDRFVPTMERSLIDQLVPARDIGAMIHGYKLLNDQFDYALGVFNGEINGGSGPPAPDSDTNKLRDIAGRVAWRPLNYQVLPEFFHRLQFGVSATTGVEHETMNPITLRLPSTVPFFAFNSTVFADGLRTRVTPEVSYFFRGFGFAAQVYRENQDMRPTTASKLLIDVPFRGGYVMATYLLTGEERTTYSEAIAPLRPFDPFHPFANPGAWELVARASRLEVGSEVFARGVARLADPTKYSNTASEMTLGFNWYLNSLVRMQFNYEHGWFGDPCSWDHQSSSGIPTLSLPACKLSFSCRRRVTQRHVKLELGLAETDDGSDKIGPGGARQMQAIQDLDNAPL